jgi:hypothetical protein
VHKAEGGGTHNDFHFGARTRPPLWADRISNYDKQKDMNLESVIKIDHKRESGEFQEEKRVWLRAKEWIKRTNNIAMAALVLSNAMPTEINAQSAIDTKLVQIGVLDKQPSTGEILIKSGKILHIPKIGGDIDSVDVFTPKGRLPDKVVVVFGQAHMLSESQLVGENDARRAEYLNHVKYNQGAIYNEIKSIASRTRIPTVCLEGIADNDADEIVRDYQKYTHLAVTYKIAPFMSSDWRMKFQRLDQIWSGGSSTTKSEYTKLKEELFPETLKAFTDANKIASSAVMVLAAEGVVRLCAGEESSTNKAVFSDSMKILKSQHCTLTNEQYIQYDKVIFGDRNDIAIKNTMAQNQDVTYIVFGSNHDFSGAVGRFNVNYADQQIALVSVHIKDVPLQTKSTSRYYPTCEYLPLPKNDNVSKIIR